MKKTNNKTSIYVKSALIAFAIGVTFGASFAANRAYASPITHENVMRLLNKERVDRGLSPLQVSDSLDFAANLKSRDMINRNYFEHYAFGLTPWDFMKNAGYDYVVAGENLAMGFNTSEGMVKAWMSSPKHRDNILNPDFQDIGVGIVKGAYVEDGKTADTAIVTNMFGRKKTVINKTLDFFKQLFSF